MHTSCNNSHLEIIANFKQNSHDYELSALLNNIIPDSIPEDAVVEWDYKLPLFLVQDFTLWLNYFLLLFIVFLFNTLWVINVQVFICSSYVLYFSTACNQNQEVQQETQTTRDIAICKQSYLWNYYCNCKTYLTLVMISYNFTSFFAETNTCDKTPVKLSIFLE